MSIYWSEVVKKIEPYVPGEQPKDKKYIKLNTNENPYPPSLRVIEAIQRAAGESLQLYPDPTCNKLRRIIAQYYGLEKEQVFVGNGADEVLAFCFMAFFNPGKRIIFPDITYTFYEVYASFFGIDYKEIPLDEEFNIPIEEFFQKNHGVVIANPNAPTGRTLTIEAIENILQKNLDRVVVVDEAYVDFGGESSVRLIKEYPNLLIIQTLSKSRSLAGLRVGIALGQEELIEGLNRVKNSINSYTLDRIALAGAEEAFRDEAYFQEIRSKVINTREKITEELRNIGFKVIDSKSNFIFISHLNVHASQLFQKLRENGVLVRYFNRPRIDNFLRVSIGTDEEMGIFYNVIKDIISS